MTGTITTDDQPLKLVTLAEVAHEVNRLLQLATGDPDPSPHWADAATWQVEASFEQIRNALAGQGPRELHVSWCAQKYRDGWVYGEVKDPVAKTHPQLIGYDELSAAQKAKDAAFVAIVTALAPYTALAD